MENNSTKHFESLLNKDRLPFSKSKTEAWQAVAARTSEVAKVIPIRVPFYSKIFKVAAIGALLLAGAGIALYFGGSQSIVNNSAMPMAYELPDGSTIHLNRDAEVEYNKYFYMIRRNTKLHGEAFFDVEKGAPFAVHTRHGVVRVLGTSFNVRSSDDTFEVQCKSGKVAVDFRSASSLELTPGNIVQIHHSEVNQFKLSPERIGLWLNAKYDFDDVVVSEVLNQVATDKGFEISWNADFTLRFTGQFSQQESLENSMDIICKPLGLDFDIDYQSKTITIHKQ